METDRKEWRIEFLRRRNALSAQERERLTWHILAHLTAMEAFCRAETVMIYRATGSEVSLDALPALPASAGKRFAYPRCLAGRQMAALIPGSWQPGPFGIPEPVPENAEEVPPEALDLVICPGVAFDGDGTRLGMGGGYYDRFLPRCHGAGIVMAAFEVQRADFLPKAPWDVPMHRIVTENGVAQPTAR